MNGRQIKNAVRLGLIILVLFSLRKVLQADAQIGHNWDFTFPYPKELFARLPVLSLYTWWASNLGFEQFFTVAHLIPNTLLAGVSTVIGPIWTTKLLTVVVVLFATLFFSKLLDYLTSPSDKNIGFALLYGFSPFLFTEIVGGSWYMWISYALAPWFMLAELKIVIQGFSKRNLLIFVLSSIFVVSSLQDFVAVETITLLFLIYRSVIQKRIWLFGRRYLTLHVILTVLNSYWLLSLMVSLGNFIQGLDVGFNGGFANPKDNTQSLPNIFNLTGYWDRNLYYNLYSYPLIIFFILVTILVWLLIIYALTKVRKKADFPVFALILMLLIIVTKGGNPPWPELTMGIFNSFKIMNLYRVSQHLMFIPAFIIPLLVAYAYNTIISGKVKPLNRKLKSRLVYTVSSLKPEYHKNRLYFILLLGIFVWISGWWWTGDLGQKILSTKGVDHLDFYRLSPALTETYQLNDTTPLNHRIVFLPAVHSPVYLKTDFQDYSQGGQPEYMYLKNRTFREEENIMGQIVNRSFCGLDKTNWLNLMSILNVKYVSVRGDILPKFSDCFNHWNNESVLAEVDSNQHLRLLTKDKYTATYELDDQYFLPRFYVPSQINSSTLGIDDLPQLLADQNYQVGSVLYLNSSEDKHEQVNNRPTLEYKMINPTKYTLVVKSASQPFHLVFSESFNPRWKVYLARLKGNQGENSDKYVSPNYYGTVQNDNLTDGHIWDTWKATPTMGEQDHLRANGYANAWIIDPQTLCAEPTGDCLIDQGQSYDFELIVEYELQRYFYYGLIISGLGLLGVLAFMVNKRNNKSP